MCHFPDDTYAEANADEVLLSPDDMHDEADIITSATALHEIHDESDAPDTSTTVGETLANCDELRSPVHPTVTPEIHPRNTRSTSSLKLWPLAVLVFYNVSGGPFGIEPSIRAAGNFYAILGFLVFPLVWAVPEALVAAELGSAFQDPSAGVAWVEEAFGENMGGLCGCLGWVSGATDNAIYPSLFLEYVTSVVGWDKEDFRGWTSFMLTSAITILLAFLNFTGLEIVGNASLIVCFIAMSPFVFMTIIGAPRIVPSRWFQLPEQSDNVDELFDDSFQISAGPLPLLSLAGIQIRPYLNNLFWSLNSFDGVASFAAETTCVRTTYPKGIFLGLVLSIICYIVPLLVALGATDYKQSEWVDGHLGAVAVDIGGHWLGVWTIFAAGISNLAVFEAELSADSFQLMGMAERGYLPKIFQKRSRYGTPTIGIILGTLVIIVFSCANFGQLLELLNANYAIAVLLEYAAFVKLRLCHKDLQRPYRIPIPDWAAFLLALPPTVGILAIFLVSNWYVYLFSIGAVLFSLVLHKLGAASKQRGWFTYETKSETIPYNLSPTIDLSKVDETESNLLPVSNPRMKDYDYKNEELAVIQVQEENKIT